MTKFVSVITSCLLIGVFTAVHTAETSVEHAIREDPDNQDQSKDRRAYNPSQPSALGASASAAAAAAAASGNRPLYPFPPISEVLCYACSDCPRVQLNTTFKHCPSSPDRAKSKSCVVYEEQYRHLKKPWVIRGCATERGSCAEIRESHSGPFDIVKLVSCVECVGDKCNTSAAGRSIVDFTIAFIALFIIPLVGKYTLS